MAKRADPGRVREAAGAGGGRHDWKAEQEHPHERCEAGGFRPGGHERRDWRRRAFVNVRRPDVKRRGRDFETETDQQHRNPGEQQRRIQRLIESRGDGGDVRRAGQSVRGSRAVNQRDPVEQER